MPEKKEHRGVNPLFVVSPRRTKYTRGRWDLAEYQKSRTSKNAPFVYT